MNAVAPGIQALIRRYRLPDDAAPALRTLLVLLATDPLAPTAVREPDKALDDHLADALVALELDAVRAAATAADMGSGAGLPGLALAIAKPDASFALVESNARKCAFLERAVAACQLTKVEVIGARVEAWRDRLGQFELATARALAPLAVVLEYGAPILALGGTLVVWRGARDSDAEAAGARAAEKLGMELAEVRRVHPYPAARARHLHVFTKKKPTPSTFPRRPGIARKRPLA